jgi:hypothetical protein
MSRSSTHRSLLAGRGKAPLQQKEITRASDTFVGLDRTVNARYEENSYTRFHVTEGEEDGEFGEIIFSNDIYPGSSVTNPNACLSLTGAAAHELAHHYRWRDKSEISHGVLTDIDEAMTSLEAALRYEKHLNSTDTMGLISDALQRLRLFVASQQQGE